MDSIAASAFCNIEHRYDFTSSRMRDVQKGGDGVVEASCALQQIARHADRSAASLIGSR